MRFTLVFENIEEGRGASYDLLFAPCPIWAIGEEMILNLNPNNPLLQTGSVQQLIELENLQRIKKCVIVVHHVGHGEIESLELLKNDLENADIIYKIVDFLEL